MATVTGTPNQDPDGDPDALEAFTETTDYPLSVVTVADADGRLSGCVVGFFTQCSIEPPRLLVCLSMLNHTYTVSQGAVGLALHLLGQEQSAVASLFAEETGDTTDKFARCSWHQGVTGAPVLDDSAAWVEGVVIDRFTVGDHEAVVVRPVSGGGGHGNGLLTYRHAPDLEPGHPAPS